MNVSFLIFIIIILEGKGWERWMPEGEKDKAYLSKV